MIKSYNNSIVLIGPRCCGKTSVAKSVASVLKAPAVDGDTFLEYIHGSIKSYTSNGENGWREFRKRETEIVKWIREHSSEPFVFSPGGGAVAHNQGENYRLENLTNLSQIGTIFYLFPFENDLGRSANLLAERQREDPNYRPPLTSARSLEEETLAIITERHPKYLAAADHVIYTGTRGVPAIAAEIVLTEAKQKYLLLN